MGSTLALLRWAALTEPVLYSEPTGRVGANVPRATALREANWGVSFFGEPLSGWYPTILGPKY